MNFKTNEYEDEDEYLLAMERLYARKEENKVKDKEWFSLWMMIETRKRKGIKKHPVTGVKRYSEKGGEDVMKDFREKYRKLKIESNRGKTAETFYMGKQRIGEAQEFFKRHEVNVKEW